MVDDTKPKQLVPITTEQERAVITGWIGSIKEIAQGPGPNLEKAQVIGRIVKLLAGEIKRFAQKQPAIPLTAMGLLVGLKLGWAGLVRGRFAIAVPVALILGSAGAFVGIIWEAIFTASRSQVGDSPTTIIDEQAEALEIFGLKPGATEEEILSAFKRLMKLVHPDVGGSSYFTNQLLRARDLLLPQPQA